MSWVAHKSGSNRERGQAIVLVALALTTIIAFTGIAIDVGLIMASRRDLVRTTDAAALAAASALSGSPSDTDATRQARAVSRAQEYALLNGFDPAGTGNELAVTFPTTDPPRKLAQVDARRQVNLAFMRLLGFDQVTVRSGGRQGEAAPLDVVIVQDVSVSQLIWNYSMGNTSCLVDPTYTGSRDPAGNIPSNRLACGYAYDPTRPTTTLTPAQWQSAYARTYTPNVPWLPFARQQWAARYFVGSLDARYDQVGVISFSTSAQLRQRLTNRFNFALNAIGDSQETPGNSGSRGLQPGGSTNIADGIAAGVNALTDFAPTGPARDTAVGAMVLLTDGSTTVRLGQTSPAAGCYSGNLSACSGARQDVMAEAQLAAQRGIVIYTIFVGDAAFEQGNSLLMQWVADQTDNRRLDGNYSGPRGLPAGYGPAFSADELKSITDNYYKADPSHPEELTAAYSSILSKIYARLVN